jgi:opacity protein-like surface antigen
MSYKNLIKSSVACAALIISATASAEQDQSLPETYGYVQLNGGPSYNMTGSGMFGNENASTTGVYGVEAGYKFDDYTRASLSLDYMPSSSFDLSASENTSGEIDGTPYSVSSSNNFKVNSWVLMFNAYYDIKNSSKVTPYFTLGAGAARTQASSTYNSATNINGAVDNDSSALGEGTKHNFAYKIGAGARYDMGDITTSEGSYATGGSTIVIPSQTAKLKAQQILLGIAYKF